MGDFLENHNQLVKGLDWMFWGQTARRGGGKQGANDPEGKGQTEEE